MSDSFLSLFQPAELSAPVQATTVAAIDLDDVPMPETMFEDKSDPTRLVPTMSQAEKSELNAKVRVLKTRIDNGEKVSLDDMRGITIWYRMKREENFRIIVEKQPKVKTVREPKPKKESTRKTKTAKVQYTLEDLI